MPVTIKQIAAEVGLSLPTVSHVLNDRGRFRPETRTRVFEAARAMGYKPSAAARSMRSGRTNHVGVVVLNRREDPDATPQNYYAVLGINEGLERAGYVLSLIRVDDLAGPEPESNGDGDGDGSPRGSRAFRERMVDGVIVLNAMPPAAERRLARSARRVVWADTTHWSDRGCVRRDEVAAGRLAVEGAVAAGYRRVVWAAGEPAAIAHYSDPDRLAGVRSASASAGVELVEVAIDPWWSPATDAAVGPLLVPGTAVIADGVFRARSIRQVADDRGLLAGRDFGLCAAEDTPDLAHTWPALARVAFDRRRLGRIAAEMMVAQLDGDGDPGPSRVLEDAWVPGRTLAGPNCRNANIVDATVGAASPAARTP